MELLKIEEIINLSGSKSVSVDFSNGSIRRLKHCRLPLLCIWKIMKKTLALFLFALISFQVGAIELSDPSNRVSCPELDNSFMCAQRIEKSIIELNKEIVSRTDGVLEIRSLSGQLYKVKENSGEDDVDYMEHYLAVGISDDKRFVSLFVQYSEGNSWAIFDRNTSILTNVCGYPIFSPKKGYIAFSEMNPYSEMTPTCLQIYEIGEVAIKEVFDAKMGNEWWSDKVKWEGEKKFIFERVKWNPLWAEEGQPDFQSESYSLKLDDGKWVMVPN